jgi:hypothetical protein
MVEARPLFDSIKQTRGNGSEFWSARDLQPCLGYEKWERFEDAIDRAKAACENSGGNAPDHFPGAGKMVNLGSGSVREVPDYHLTRYACYLIAMNGDPRKPEIAMAQTYFAVSTYQNEQRQVVPPTQGQLLVAMAQAYEAHERRLLELATAQATTQVQVTDIAARVEGMQARQQEATEELTALPAPAGDVPGLTARAQLNRLVRSYCLENGFGHSEAWGRLYLEFRDRYHVDLKARASSKKPPLDIAEAEGLMDKLYALAYHLFGRKAAS